MNDREDHALLVASFRYRIIAEAVEASGEGVSAAVKEASATTFPAPWGEHVQVSMRQIWRWMAAYNAGGLLALRPKSRVDIGQLRAVPIEVMEAAAALRRENSGRPTKTVIDILERKKVVARGKLKRSTLDRRLARLGLSRRSLRTLGRKVFKKIETHAPLELCIADFHHGPYVRQPGEEVARKALLLVFIDHFSRYVPEGRYYLHEDFAALRFGFRRLLLICGPFGKLYMDNGPSFQTGRFHAACKNKEIDIWYVHSKPYQSECRGCVERFNRTIKEQFEDEVRQRDELLTLDELNGYFEAWLAERYHRDVHSETGQAPFDRWRDNVTLRQAPDLQRIEELLRLRKRAKVHPKWSTVECQGVRYSVDPALRGRKVHVLYDAMDPGYVLIELDRRIAQRAEPQRPGHCPAQPEPPPVPKEKTNYLQLLRDDYEQRLKSDLAALDLRPAAIKRELAFVDFAALLQTCRGTELRDFETAQAQERFRKLRPIEPDKARRAVDAIRRRLGLGLHISVYLDALQTNLVQERAKKGPRS